jgi:ferrochelatase
MRYGSGSIGYAISKMVDHGFNRILVAPLYPQYCGATTASVMDAVTAQLQSMRSQPAIRTLPPYYNDPIHIAALKSSIERQIAELDFAPERLLLSFHGMPERTRTLGDPYYEQCKATAALIASQVNLPVDLAFQSRFGRARWLQPATEMVLALLSSGGDQSHRHRDPRLFRRLPGDAGGTRHPRPRNLPQGRRHPFLPGSTA